MNLRTLAFVALLVGPGCVGKVQLSGTLHGDDPDPTNSGLAFDAIGTPHIGGRRVFLPQAQEGLHYGVVVVDTTALPPGWQPKHAKQGGIMVAAIDRASPFVPAGLAPFDLIVELDGEPVEQVEDVIEALDDQERVALTVISARDGQQRTIEAEAVDEVQGSGAFKVPFVFEHRHSSSGTSMSLGGDTVFNISGARIVGEDYARERFEWGALFNLIYYERETDLHSSATYRRFRLLWFIDSGDRSEAFKRDEEME